MSTREFVIETKLDPAKVDKLIAQLAGDAKSYGAEPMRELAVFVRDDDGAIRGGVYGEMGWGWLYIDLLWVDEALQGKGHGRHVMNVIEQHALKNKIDHVYVATTSFQALPFYYHYGFRLFGVLEHRPPGHNYYYLERVITPAKPPPDYTIVADPPLEDIQVVAKGLTAHNLRRGVKSDGKRLAIFLHDDAGEVRGGLVGSTYWGWLDLQLFRVDSDWRNQGYGKQMLALAEQEAKARGCPHVVLDITDFQSLEFFYAMGYSPFAQLMNRPNGHITHFLRKDL